MPECERLKTSSLLGRKGFPCSPVDRTILSALRERQLGQFDAEKSSPPNVLPAIHFVVKRIRLFLFVRGEQTLRFQHRQFGGFPDVFHGYIYIVGDV